PGFSVGIFPGENLPGLSCVSALRFVHLVGGQARLVLGGVDRAQCRPAGFEHCLLLGGRQLGAAFLAAIASMLDRLFLESHGCESTPREIPQWNGPGGHSTSRAADPPTTGPGPGTPTRTRAWPCPRQASRRCWART